MGKIVRIFITLVLVAVGVGGIYMANDNEPSVGMELYCYDETHRGVYPVNPYCSKCNDRDGIIVHECKNPDGEDKYCNSCGKLLPID